MSFANETTYYNTPAVLPEPLIPGPQSLPCAYPSDTFQYEPEFANLQTYFPPRYGPTYVPAPCPPALNPTAISPGGQDLTEHRFTTSTFGGRYPAQKYNSNIFIR